MRPQIRYFHACDMLFQSRLLFFSFTTGVQEKHSIIFFRILNLQTYISLLWFIAPSVPQWKFWLHYCIKCLVLLDRYFLFSVPPSSPHWTDMYIYLHTILTYQFFFWQYRLLVSKKKLWLKSYHPSPQEFRANYVGIHNYFTLHYTLLHSHISLMICRLLEKNLVQYALSQLVTKII